MVEGGYREVRMSITLLVKIFLFVVASLLWQMAVYVGILYGAEKVWAVFLPILLYFLSFCSGFLLLTTFGATWKSIVILYIVNWAAGFAVTVIFGIRDAKMKRKERT